MRSRELVLFANSLLRKHFWCTWEIEWNHRQTIGSRASGDDSARSLQNLRATHLICEADSRLILRASQLRELHVLPVRKQLIPTQSNGMFIYKYLYIDDMIKQKICTCIFVDIFADIILGGS